jgi:S1-C subfamily serine protease
MGVGLYTVDQTVVFRYRLGVDQGTLITQVADGSPANDAGLKAGDVITAIDGKAVASVDDLTHIIHGDKIGQEIQVTYYRGSNQSTASLTLVQSPPPSTP